MNVVVDSKLKATPVVRLRRPSETFVDFFVSIVKELIARLSLFLVTV